MEGNPEGGELTSDREVGVVLIFSEEGVWTLGRHLRSFKTIGW